MGKKSKTTLPGHDQNETINGRSRKSDESEDNNTEIFEGIDQKAYEKEVDFFRQKKLGVDHIKYRSNRRYGQKHPE